MEDVIDKVRKWSIRYDGDKDVIDFVERVEELASAYRIEQDKLISALPELLKGTALQWLRNNRDQYKKWSDIKKGLILHFLPTNYKGALEEEIRQKHQKPKEPAKEYITDMQTLTRRIGHNEKTQLQIIYEHLRAEYRLYIHRRDFRTIRELERLTDEYEEIKKAENRQKSLIINEVSDQAINLSKQFQTPIQTAVPFNPINHCWNCGKSGHFRDQCQGQRRLFCAKCGKYGNYETTRQRQILRLKHQHLKIRFVERYP